MLVTYCSAESHFIDAFYHMGRGNQYSYDGLCALYKYYNELSDDLGEDIELDVIAICCDWTEYDDEEEMLEEHGLRSVTALESRTTVIATSTSWLVMIY